MSISHAIHSLIAKLGSEICVVSEADGKQVHITGLIQNDTGIAFLMYCAAEIRGICTR